MQRNGHIDNKKVSIKVDCLDIFWLVQFKINHTYYGSIYRNASGIQTHRLKIFSHSLGYLLPSSFYNLSENYVLIAYFNIPKYPFLFQQQGIIQMTQQDGEWVRLIFTLDIAVEIVSCVKYHLNVSLVKKGTIYVKMILVYQDAHLHKRNQMVLIVRITIRKHLNMRVDFDPGQYAQYTLISQNGTNFLKGSDIYYSFLLGRRVFGGPFVWAQAKFLRIHNIISPHFSVTITFYIVYGSSFPSDGQFIYTIENNITVSKFITNTTLSNTDETKQDRTDERIHRNTSLLTITWECYGPNNEPVQGFADSTLIILLFMIASLIVQNVQMLLHVLYGTAHMILVSLNFLKQNV
ncbi:unnamed protein product [Paramecium octaurelia]|uniref:Uncharacterized protein n=1 Tax=Paramecium octaurelia TaxID=43137 RepID=A0A8S1WF36_PAROT|nr:unnamed protein product [Paramecium octaurelia]